MKLKEINRTAMLSWSPAQHHPIYIASGTSAQQLDASFSTNASLEFFKLDLADSTLDMKPCGALSSSHRYHKLVWSPFGSDGHALPSGVLVAGGENGNVILYDPAKIMSGLGDVVVAESDRHTGPVRALDINPFQTNLIASGGNESEIYIWDLNNFGSPMTPGPKTQPLEDISCVAWNRQVQHILASSGPSGRTSVWDLRKNDLIIKVSDHSNRMHCSGMAWNPEVATQLVMASEDDRMPVIQMWDLRFAASPLKIFENHTRGVLAIAWSCADPELLLSCGKDGRILCWNPNTAEVLYELPTGNQWCFDIQWCPRNPAVFSAAGFDGYVNIYSIMGGTNPAQSQRHVDQISSSFSSMDPFGTGQTLPPLELPQSATLPSTVHPLKKPPKWIRTPAGALFAFGGKLVSVENEKPNPQRSLSTAVHLSQVVTETDFLKRSDQLQATLSSGQFVEFCQEKISLSGNEFERTVWSFLKANFDGESRTKFLELLGYKKEELALKISAALSEKPAKVHSSVPPKAEPVADPTVTTEADPTVVAPEDPAVVAPEDPAVVAPEDPAVVAPEDPAVVAPEDPAVVAPADPGAVTVADPSVIDATPADLTVTTEADPGVVALADLGAIVGPADSTVVASADPAVIASADPAIVAPADPTVIAPADPGVFAADSGEAVFDLISSGALQPAVSPQLDVTPNSETNEVSEAEETPADVFDMIASEQTLEPASDPVQDVFDMISTKQALNPASDPVQDVFDMIASEQTLDPVQNEETPAGNPEETATLLEGCGKEVVDQAPDVLNDDEDQWDEEEIILDEEVSEPVNDLLAPSVDDLPERSVETEEPVVLQCVELNVEPVEDTSETPAPVEDSSLSVSRDVDGLITQALLTGDFEGAVELCLHDNRMADGIILAIAGGSELLQKTQKKYFQKSTSKLNKLLSAVVMKDLRDILETCELHNWKEALAAVMTYAQPQELFSLCDLLGDRLEAANDTQLRAQACLSYICAGNIEKVVSCWTKAQKGNSPLVLQDLVEKVVVMKHAVEQTQKTGPVAIGVLLAKSMSEYANLLASQGRLSTAITYLPDENGQLGFAQLRQRLVHALGQQDTQPQPSKERTAAAKPNNPYSAQASSTAAQMQYYQPVRAASTVTSWSNQTPTAFPPVPNPPPSSSVPELPKVEPPNSLYGMTAPAAAAPSAPVMYSHQYQNYPQVTQCPQGVVYQPQHYSSVAPALPEASAGLSQCPVPSHSVYPPHSQRLSFSSSSSVPLFSPSSSSSFCPLPPSAAASIRTGPDTAGLHLQPPPQSGASAPLNGWNDPPTLSRLPKKKQVTEHYTPPAPITAPIMAPVGVAPVGGAPAGVDPQAQFQTSGSQPFMSPVPAPYPGLQQQPPQAPPALSFMNVAAPKTSTEGPPGAPTGDIIQPRQPLISEKITKKPIPDEHLVLKTTFEGLIQKCLAVANDPQTKRKLDDANKRMEALYDKLREQTLSPAIVGGLHSIARTVDSRSYAEGLSLHTHIVSSSNFSEISGFMPVLKVVLTQANRLGV